MGFDSVLSPREQLQHEEMLEAKREYLRTTTVTERVIRENMKRANRNIRGGLDGGKDWM